MILADSSVWIRYLRADNSVADREMTRLIDSGKELVVTGPIAMELLAGPIDEFTVRRLESQLEGLPSLTVDHRDFREAAAIQRACRRQGHTIRNMIDCLIAAIAIRHDAELLHKDVDFERIAAVTDLRQRSLL